MRFALPILAVFYLWGAASADEDDWKTYTSKEGKFSILWPGEPKVTQSKHPKTGTIKTRYQAKSPGSDIQLLFVDVADLPSAEVKKNGFEGTMKALKEGLTSGRLAATVVSEEKITLGKAKHPGKDFVLHLPDKSTYIRLRACLAGERLYAVTLVAPKSTVEGKLVGKLFASFTPNE
jgi:hypothetical protein